MPNDNKQTTSNSFWLSVLGWPRRKVRQLYEWMVGWAETKQATWALAIFAFMESSFFPIPPDPLLAAMTLAKPRRFLKFAFICTVGSTFGGIFGYFIGAGLFEAIGRPLIEVYGLQEEFINIGVRYEAHAALTVFGVSFTPLPYKLITISAGVFKINFAVFLLASIIGRGLRFYLLAFLMHYFGERFQDKIRKYVDVLSIVFIVLLVLGFVAIKYLF